jgi:hypothetical protein
VNTQNGMATTNHAYTSSSGSGTAFDIMNPTLAINYIIKT